MSRLDDANISWVATFLFVVAFFFIKIEYGSNEYFLVPIYRLEFVSIVVFSILYYFKNTPSLQRTKRIFSVLSFLVFVQFLYFFTLNTYPIAGSLGGYIQSSLKVYGFIISATLYGCLFYKEGVLVDVFYKVGKISLGVGLLALLVFETTGISFLIDFTYGNPRTQSFFTEPSAAAPAVAAVAALGWKKRDWVGGGIALVYAFTARSPTVLLVFLLSIVGIFLGRRGPKVLWGGIASVFFGGTIFVVLGGLDWLKTTPLFGKTVNRLARGVEYIITLSGQGYNPRFSGAINVYSHLKENGLLWFGYGLNSASVYFENVYTAGATDTQDFSLLITLLFSFGIVGVVLYIYLCYKSYYVIYKNRSSYMYIFIPFCVTSMINSAQGFNTYKFVILGIVFYGVGKAMNRSR